MWKNLSNTNVRNIGGQTSYIYIDIVCTYKYEYFYLTKNSLFFLVFLYYLDAMILNICILWNSHLLLLCLN